MAYVQKTSFFRSVPGLFGCANALVSTKYFLLSTHILFNVNISVYCLVHVCTDQTGII
jgi:hypothetical protein